MNRLSTRPPGNRQLGPIVDLSMLIGLNCINRFIETREPDTVFIGFHLVDESEVNVKCVDGNRVRAHRYRVIKKEYSDCLLAKGNK